MVVGELPFALDYPYDSKLLVGKQGLRQPPVVLSKSDLLACNGAIKYFYEQK